MVLLTMCDSGSTIYEVESHIKVILSVFLSLECHIYDVYFVVFANRTSICFSFVFFFLSISLFSLFHISHIHARTSISNASTLCMCRAKLCAPTTTKKQAHQPNQLSYQSNQIANCFCSSIQNIHPSQMSLKMCVK